MLAVRLNQLAAGGSGISGPILDALEAMLAADALPDVREHGSIGTADLAALAVTALTVSGQAPAANPPPATVGAEEDASFASLAARQALDAAQNLRTVLACELVAAVRALRSRGIAPACDRLARALNACAELPAGLPDRNLTADIEAAGRILDALAEIPLSR